VKRLIGALMLTALCAGCSAGRTAGHPAAAPAAGTKVAAPQDFSPGTCRSAAEQVISVQSWSNRLLGQHEVSMTDRTGMKKDQDALIAMMPKADPAKRKQLQALVTAIGFARLRLDLKTYDTKLMDDVAHAGADLQAACVG
jgi:hypothetical protein